MKAELTLEIGKQMFVSGMISLKQFALHHYTEEELTKKEFPKSWNDVKGNCTISMGAVVFKTYEEVQSFAMLAKLVALRNEWWEIDGNWKPDYTIPCKSKYCVCNFFNKLTVDSVLGIQHIFTFRTREIAQEFLETFRESLEICKSLI